MDWIIIIILGLYILSPLDFIPDFIPIIGWIDDIFAFILILGVLRRGEKNAG